MISVQFISLVAQSCLTLCDSMDCSIPGFPVLHHLPELAQIHVHQVSGAIQPSRPLLSPFPHALNFSQHQVAKVLELQLRVFYFPKIPSWLGSNSLTGSGLVAQWCPTLQLHGLQHTRLPCPSPTPGACSNSCPSSRWCHPTISSSGISCSSCLQSFPAQDLFQWVSS